MPLEGNGNHFGVVYAGVQFTVAEMLGGIIALATFDSAKYYPLVKNVDIKFTGMARTDLRAEASLDEDEIGRIETEAAEKGKADFTLDAVVKDEAGQTVSVTRGLYQLRAHGSELGPVLARGPSCRPLRQLPARPREVAGVAARDSAPGSPGARARPPRSRSPGVTSVTTLPGHRPDASTSAMVSSATRFCSSSV